MEVAAGHKACGMQGLLCVIVGGKGGWGMGCSGGLGWVGEWRKTMRCFEVRGDAHEFGMWENRWTPGV